MFSYPKIFLSFPELVSYIGTRDILVRPKQFHAENRELQDGVKKLEAEFWVQKAFFLAQCQSSKIIEVTENNLKETLFADACFTKLPYISLNIVTADCVPILFYDSKKKIIWVIHAGWRGSSEKILEKTLYEVQKIYKSDIKDIFLYIWPSICGKCYEVGWEVAEIFPNHTNLWNEKYFLDLKTENLEQALKNWVLKENIEISNDCTFELPEKYFSYRREKLKANFVCGISLQNL